MKVDTKKIEVIVKLYWIRIIIFTILGILFVLSVILVINGIKQFMQLEAFYKRMQLASVPIQLLFSIVTAFIFATIYVYMWFWLWFGGGLAKMGQKKIKPLQVNVKWEDVIGMESIKNDVWEVIQLIKDRARLKKVGGKVIKGVLLIGPPGCGKTYLAKAIATEAGVPFLSAVGSEFMGIFVGLGAQRLRNLFKRARALAELYGGCIIFIDEIDTIARPRVGVSGFGAGMDYNATINQLLTELDGLRQKEHNIVVIGATNVSENELDRALMRAGRFDRKIYVGYPNLEERKKLFEFYLKKVNFDPNSVNTDVLARKTVGFSPADIANCVREASLISVRKGREKVTMEDLSEAYDRVMFGLKSNITLSEREKEWVAYHEAGHAIVAYLTHPTDDVVKATIIPRKGYLGYAMPVPKEEIHISDKERLLAEIKTLLGSYVAEKLKFGKTSNGVDQDFKRAYQIAHNMVWKWGMGPSGLIGNFESEDVSWYGGRRYNLLSDKTKERLDEDVQKILKDCLKEVEDLLTKERDLLETFAQELLKKEELDYDEIVELFKKYGKEKSSPN